MLSLELIALLNNLLRQKNNWMVLQIRQLILGQEASQVLPYQLAPHRPSDPLEMVSQQSFQLPATSDLRNFPSPKSTSTTLTWTLNLGMTMASKIWTSTLTMVSTRKLGATMRVRCLIEHHLTRSWPSVSIYRMPRIMHLRRTSSSISFYHTNSEALQTPTSHAHTLFRCPYLRKSNLNLSSQNILQTSLKMTSRKSRKRRKRMSLQLH